MPVSVRGREELKGYLEGQGFPKDLVAKYLDLADSIEKLTDGLEVAFHDTLQSKIDEKVKIEEVYNWVSSFIIRVLETIPPEMRMQLVLAVASIVEKMRLSRSITEGIRKEEEDSKIYA